MGKELHGDPDDRPDQRDHQKKTGNQIDDPLLEADLGLREEMAVDAKNPPPYPFFPLIEGLGDVGMDPSLAGYQCCDN